MRYHCLFQSVLVIADLPALGMLHISNGLSVSSTSLWEKFFYYSNLRYVPTPLFAYSEARPRGAPCQASRYFVRDSPSAFRNMRWAPSQGIGNRRRLEKEVVASVGL